MAGNGGGGSKEKTLAAAPFQRENDAREGRK